VGWYHFAFFALSVAMFGMTVGAVLAVAISLHWGIAASFWAGVACDVAAAASLAWLGLARVLAPVALDLAAVGPDA
jgi:hypothetical protein